MADIKYSLGGGGILVDWTSVAAVGTTRSVLPLSICLVEVLTVFVLLVGVLGA